MRLIPYPEPQRRHHKVLKHVFDHRQRWWEVFGDLLSWHEDHSELRGLGCLTSAEPPAVPTSAEPVLERAHRYWLQSAEQACDQALETCRVYPADEGRSCYVGDLGVTVYASKTAELATCFRPRHAVGSRLTPSDNVSRADARARRKSGYALRAAVRRATHRASLLDQTPRRSP